jgi:hypothetical protein
MRQAWNRHNGRMGGSLIGVLVALAVGAVVLLIVDTVKTRRKKPSVDAGRSVVAW